MRSKIYTFLSIVGFFVILGALARILLAITEEFLRRIP